MRWLIAILLMIPAIALAGLININTATESELESLPGIGASKATAIIQYRTDHGAFKSVDELNNVSGIGDATLATLRPLVTVGDGKTATAATPTTTTPEVHTMRAPAPLTPAPTNTAPAAACAVNINTADASGLQNLPGIGETKAAAILQYRTDHGNFASCDALDDVSGIGPATIAGLKDCCTVK